jgi:hypothetical protein
MPKKQRRRRRSADYQQFSDFDDAALNALKRTSALRRVPIFASCGCLPVPGLEGAVCAFELGWDAPSIVVEEASGRSMILAPGDIFLGTTGYRESTRWAVGGMPKRGLVPGSSYWVLAECGVVGDLTGDSPQAMAHLGQVKYLGTVASGDGVHLNMRQFAVTVEPPAADCGAPLFLVLGTSAEVGKTTAATVVLRSLRRKGATRITALKATGTSSFSEIAVYRDFGANQIFDCVDFGLPTTYPTDRSGMKEVFSGVLDTCLSIPSDAVLVECGGDILGANVPVFLDCLRHRRSDAKVILAAADALGALSAKGILEDKGFVVALITGPCTDTVTLQARTQTLCEVPAINMARGGSHEALF